MSDQMLLEGELLLLGGAGLLRVWGCMAQDLATSTRCCACCKYAREVAEWWSNLLLVIAGVILLLVAISTLLGAQDVGFNLLLELAALTIVLVIVMSGLGWQGGEHEQQRSDPLLGSSEQSRRHWRWLDALRSSAMRTVRVFQDRPASPDLRPSAPPEPNFAPLTGQALRDPERLD
ncbi:unnamed protein product [Symbiodinium microadriaticum]|nr:unnamed protein product [Symbiodinium microadriaticum]